MSIVVDEATLESYNCGF